MNNRPLFLTKDPKQVERLALDLDIGIHGKANHEGRDVVLCFTYDNPDKLKWEYVKAGARSAVYLGPIDSQGPQELLAFVKQKKTEGLDWRKRFHTVDQLAEGDLKFLIEDILPEGVTFIGALSGAGKTWFALSMAKALTTSRPFLNVWPAPESVNVLYLCPEMSGRAVRSRAEKLGIKERFYCQTMCDGVCSLTDPELEMAIEELKPVVFLDTAIRFGTAEDENSSSQNARGLATGIFALVNLGARSVVGLHHSPKDSAEKDYMTLENVLRGTGDIGAMCDAAWGLQRDRGGMTNPGQAYIEESERLNRLQVRCVKSRDFEPAEQFRIQGKPYIDEKGDFAVLSDNPYQTKVKKMLEAIEADPHVTKEALARLAGISRNRISEVATKEGWEWKDKKIGWEHLPVH